MGSHCEKIPKTWVSRLESINFDFVEDHQTKTSRLDSSSECDTNYRETLGKNFNNRAKREYVDSPMVFAFTFAGGKIMDGLMRILFFPVPVFGVSCGGPIPGRSLTSHMSANAWWPFYGLPYEQACMQIPVTTMPNAESIKRISRDITSIQTLDPIFPYQLARPN